MSDQGSERACARTKKSHLSRRALLSAAAAAPAVAVPAMAAPHPDAALLAAWRGYQQAHRDYDAACARLPDGGTETDTAPLCRRIDAYQAKIERLPARSVAGVAVKLRLLFAQQIMSIDAHRSAIHDAPVTPELAAEMDADDENLWALIHDVERMTISKEASI